MKLKAGSITLLLLLPLPFVHWIGDVASVIYISLLFVFASLFRLGYGKVPERAIKLLIFVFIYLMAVAIINEVSIQEFLDFSAGGHLKLSYQATSLFMVVILLAALPRLSKVQSHRLFYIYYVIFLVTIISEWILVNVLGVANSRMPAYKNIHGYAEVFYGFYRPFGLTGNAPVNGSMLVLATWIMILFVKPSRAKCYLALTLAALVLNNSGQALLSFFITCVMYLAGRYRGGVKFYLFVIGGCMLYGIIYSGIFVKLSSAYMLNVNQYWHFEIFNQMDIVRIMFGGYSFCKDLFADINYSTEFYPVYAVSRFGLLITLAVWIYIWLKLPSRGRLIVFVALFAGSIHYATILYIPPLVLLASLMTSGCLSAPHVPVGRRSLRS